MNTLISLLMLIFLLGQGAANAAVGTDKEILQAIANGYVANRECVERCKATLVAREGRALNLEAAKRGELQDPVEARGVYLCDGSRKKYELVHDPEAVKSHTIPDPGGKLFAPCEFRSMRLLTDGISILTYVPSYNPFSGEFDKLAFIEAAEIHPLGGFASFPLSVGFREPGANGIAEQLGRYGSDSRGPRSVKLERDVLFEGRKVHVVTLEFEGGATTYWIDYERGCIPPRTLSRTDELGDLYDDLNQHVSLIGGKMWFPSRKVNYFYPARRVKILEVGEIQIDPPIADADFELTFPEPVSILDKVHSRSYKNAASFSLSRLDHPDKVASRPIRITRSAPPPVGTPVLPGEIESSRSWITYLALSIASFLVVLVIYRVVRAKRGSLVGGV